MASVPSLFGVPFVFVLFALTLVGIGAFNRRSLEISVAGFVSILAVRLIGGEFHWMSHFKQEWAKATNLFGLLIGFALVADHFEQSRLPDRLPHLLPRGARGAFALLALVWALSGVLDNIAAALIGAAAASRVFTRLHPGYVAAIVAAANAGGAGSVIGDTTTTMMWIEGVPAATVLAAYFAAGVALLLFGGIAARQQTRFAELVAPSDAKPVDRARVVVVVASIAALAISNLFGTLWLGARAEAVPLLALAVWLVLVGAARTRPFNWRVAREAFRAACFLILLVLSASLLPVEALPRPTFGTTVALGFFSSIFDNIPLTKVALVQGGYDWAFLAYSVGFGGSMLWFGSSAGVAVSERLPTVRSVATWVRHGWHIPLAFLAGHAALYLVRGWRP